MGIFPPATKWIGGVSGRALALSGRGGFVRLKCKPVLDGTIGVNVLGLALYMPVMQLL